MAGFVSDTRDLDFNTWSSVYLRAVQVMLDWEKTEWAAQHVDTKLFVTGVSQACVLAWPHSPCVYLLYHGSSVSVCNLIMLSLLRWMASSNTHSTACGTFLSLKNLQYWNLELERKYYL